MSTKTFLFPATSSMTGVITAGNLLQGGTAGTISITFTSGVAVQYQPNVSVTAGSFVAGVTYTITSIGTTNFNLIGAPANFTVGTQFTATGVGSGTGTATIAIQSCVLNGFAGLPVGTYISGFVSGAAGGTGVYTLANQYGAVIIPAFASQTFTQGQHFTNATSAATSLPLTTDGPVQAFVLHQNSGDTGSVANDYIQGSIDGGQNWVNVSGALALSSTATAIAYNSYTSANLLAYNTYRVLVGTVTGTANVGGTMRSIQLDSRQ